MNIACITGGTSKEKQINLEPIGIECVILNELGWYYCNLQEGTNSFVADIELFTSMDIEYNGYLGKNNKFKIGYADMVNDNDDTIKFWQLDCVKIVDVLHNAHTGAWSPKTCAIWAAINQTQIFPDAIVPLILNFMHSELEWNTKYTVQPGGQGRILGKLKTEEAFCYCINEPCNEFIVYGVNGNQIGKGRFVDPVVANEEQQKRVKKLKEKEEKE